MGFNVWVVAVFALVVLAGRSSAEIVGCGGFVEASHALVSARGAAAAKLDYSFISVELVSDLGVVKEKTECSPNGYYFIPVYDKGSYMLRVAGPDGWTFDPPSTHVDVGEACGTEEYVNFKVTGFSLTGSVKSGAGGKSCPQSGNAGPEGVKLTLKRPDGSTTSAVSDANGRYSFGNLSSGVYTVSASHSSWKLDGAPREVTIDWGNVAVAKDFTVTGYDLTGSVVADGNPILGVQVFLYSDDFQALPDAPPPSSTGPSGHGKPLAVATSKEDGTFGFSGLPCASYKLVPFYRGEQTVFDVSPAEVEVTVGHGGAVIEEPFWVTGFSVSGRVLNDKGEGIASVKIVINGADGGVTSADGRYSIDKVSSSTKYTIEASKPHHRFPSLSSLTILPSMATLPDVIADAYDLCGVVISPDHSSSRQVALTHGPAGVGPKTAPVDTSSGKYCFSVPAGEYVVSPVVSSQEKAAGVLFTPASKEVKLSSGPLLNVDFTPTKVTVSGSVICLSPPCGESVTVTLSPIGTHAPAQTEHLQPNDPEGKFSFSEITPGNYKVSAKTQNSWCWVNNGEAEFEVGAEDVTGLELTQAGFSMKVESSHAVNGTIELFGGSASDAIHAPIKTGAQEFCLPKPGVYSLSFERACVYFGKKAFEFDTAAPAPINLRLTHFLTRGSISIDSKTVPDADALAEEIYVSSAPAGSAGTAAEKIPVLLARKATGDDVTVVYEYAKWAAPGEALVLTPAHSNLLFYPRSRTTKVPSTDTTECPAKVPAFEGRPGLKVEGSINPPEEGVKVEVKFVSPSKTAGGEAGAVAVTAFTDKRGKYSVGPLYDDAEYEAVASKPGFQFRQFTPGDKWSFEGLKLGKIVVEIGPGSGAEQPLPSVLLSLSGDQRYQKNAATGEGGSLTFEELFPGTFYLKPLLKEYRFEPANAVIEVGSGQSKTVRFVAHRTAFSVLGTVRLLGGHVAEGVTVVAVSDGSYEEAVTDASGQYRLRGLAPNTEYTVRIKTDVSSRVERAAPGETAVSVTSADKDGVDFLVFERPGKCTITGVAEGDEEYRPQVTVEVVSASSSSVARAVQLPFSRFFEVGGLAPGKYVVKLAFGLSDRTHSFEAESVEVDLGEGCKPTHVGTLHFSAAESHEKHDAPVTPLVPILGFAVAIYLFFKYTNVQSFTGGGSAPSSSPGSFTSGMVTRAKAKEPVDASPVAARKPVVRRRTSTY
ncbi:Nodal modulator like protein [Klebsormidium nitens]|uniref:Nodal modulator like protein n=1 Tax=Klebsormidium nitens TaxID=105231 RepID=A0A1Y1HZP8_KLENI|nr:Nodal modulator like protein [Klebsormidium nitens]|eukprot:GAQ84160.1 Nodal modulator like protein [Klebsormidium nitens]